MWLTLVDIQEKDGRVVPRFKASDLTDQRNHPGYDQLGTNVDRRHLIHVALKNRLVHSHGHNCAAIADGTFLKIEL